MPSKKLCRFFQVSGPLYLVGQGTIRGIEFSRNGDHFVVNCSDRTLRVYKYYLIYFHFSRERTEDLSLSQKYSDPVHRVQWRMGTFSSSAEYVVGGSLPDTLGAHKQPRPKRQTTTSTSGSGNPGISARCSRARRRTSSGSPGIRCGPPLPRSAPTDSCTSGRWSSRFVTCQ